MGLPVLSNHQQDAVFATRTWHRDNHVGLGELDQLVFYLGGFAGTGKSTILPVIIEALGLNPDDVEFAAPTGKAAKVMTEKLKQFGIMRRARTIHSLIYRPKPIRAEVLERQLRDLKDQRDYLLREGDMGDPSPKRLAELEKSIELTEHDLDKALDMSEGPKFSLNVDSDLRKSKLLVCDEGSMVGTSMADDLRSFGVPILVLADPGQLPPVGDTPGFCDRIPDFFLTEIHRQARDNPIIRLATDAREEKSIKVGRYGDGVDVVERIRDTATYDESREAQIIVGTNKRRWFITQKLRGKLGFSSSGPMAGEPLIICKNSRTVPDLVNGSFVNCVHDTGDLVDGHDNFTMLVEDELGVQRNIRVVQGLFEEHTLLKKGAASAHKSAAFRARIEYEHADWGWAITCHKAQGSQWDDVILHDESGMFKDDWAKWLYTGITRAAQRLTIVL